MIDKKDEKDIIPDEGTVRLVGPKGSPSTDGKGRVEIFKQKNGEPFVLKVSPKKVLMLHANKWDLILEKLLEIQVHSKLVKMVIKTSVCQMALRSKLLTLNVQIKKN